MDESEIPAKVKGVSWQDFNVGLVILHAAKEMVFELNETAGFIWGQIDGNSSLQEIKARLIEDFDITDAEADQDVRSFIQELSARDLIEWKN